ncbi:putative acyl-CoA dehydrogenase [Filomicrobium insigne]|uniref:Acyl-CoA dehydrogenase n=1 Tax=Filomicrobium insigne TaxID=418854 RepID=A0A1H0T726_9HYPH|nr:acyl-CoA dehydrogenase family protein [Filomicrobium insigne]SDP49530.1 putative acyl-CoA dehydrogenase [Filomicrobium insigne]
MHSSFSTHEITNQSPSFCDINLFLSDAALQSAIAAEGAAHEAEELARFGQKAGSAQAFEAGRLANENPPKLRRFDEKGFPLDTVEFHPAYHGCMAMSFAAGLHCSPWDYLGAAESGPRPRPGAHVVRAATLYMMTQVEPGHVCPVTMTNAAVPTLLLQPDLATSLLPKILSRTYDKAFRPWPQKESVSIGMGLTEKQGGTDVRANASTAIAAVNAGAGQEYILTGHKWFMSAPMSDAFLMLAQAPGGLSCFLVPRFLPDGSINALRLQRLKNKLGNHSNASSEVELQGASGWLIGEEGRGIANIIEMVTMTRLDCAVASAGQMRLALAVALHHCHYRYVFQKRLVDQPMMAAVLADMAIDVEAATVLAVRLAGAFERAWMDPHEAAWRRVMTPVTKYWVCKMAPALGFEAMECLGGNGYVEDGLAARLYRELPLNAIWEGSGNVMCLDLLRVLQRTPEAVWTVMAVLKESSAGDAVLSASVARLETLMRGSAQEGDARTLVETLARTAAGCLLRQSSPDFMADAFIASRLGGEFRHTYGTGVGKAGHREILERARPLQ